MLARNLSKSEKISKDNSDSRITLTCSLQCFQSHNLWGMANADTYVIRGDCSETSADEAGKQFFNRMIRVEAGVAIVLMDVWVRQINKAVYTATSVACGWAGAVRGLCKPQNRPTDGQTDGRTDRHSASWWREGYKAPSLRRIEEINWFKCSVKEESIRRRKKILIKILSFYS